MYVLKKSLNNKNALREVEDSRTSSGIASFDYDPSIKSFLDNSWNDYLKCDKRRAMTTQMPT